MFMAVSVYFSAMARDYRQVQWCTTHVGLPVLGMLTLAPCTLLDACDGVL
jgi:hypothetical protein